MKTLVIALLAITVGSVGAQANGVALCIAKGKNSKGNHTDVEYFLRYGGSEDTSGYAVGKAARSDHDQKYNKTPNCRNSARDYMNGGYYVILKGGRTKDYAGAPTNRWALGFGENSRAALKDAIEELQRRDWSWQKRHGYDVVDQGVF